MIWPKLASGSHGCLSWLSTSRQEKGALQMLIRELGSCARLRKLHPAEELLKHICRAEQGSNTAGVVSQSWEGAGLRSPEVEGSHGDEVVT